MAYFLDATGLNLFWTKVKEWLADNYTNEAFKTITTQDSSGNAKTNGSFSAASKEDTLSIREGTNVTFGVDANTRQLTINATDTTYNNATTDTAGLMSASDKTKLNGIATGAQVNVIETIKKNGTALTVTSKAVDISVPTKTSDISNDSNFAVDANYIHTDNNYTDSEKTKLGGVATGAQVNVIETVKVNGSALTPSSKAVDISVPTNNNQLTNGAGYQTANDVATAIAAAVSSAYIYKGTVADAEHLPTTGQTVGDVYNITAASTYGPAGMNVAWTGSAWDALGSSISVEAISATTITDIVNQTGDYAPTP